MSPGARDKDELDGCDINFAEYEDTAVTVEMRPLFPDGKANPARADEWAKLAREEGPAPDAA